MMTGATKDFFCCVLGVAGEPKDLRLQNTCSEQCFAKVDFSLTLSSPHWRVPIQHRPESVWLLCTLLEHL